MKTQFLAVCALLLLTMTTALAQVGNANAAERPAVVMASANWRMKPNERPLEAVRGNEMAQLYLTEFLFAYKVVTVNGEIELEPGGMPRGTGIWAIPLPGGQIREMAFTADGNLVVYSTANTVLWQSSTAGRGHQLKLHANGVLEILDEAGKVVWSQK